MPTRREVLKSTALAVLGSALPVSVTAKQVLSVPVIVVYEDGITESIAFKEALKHRASGIYALKQDPAETFRELYRAWRAESIVLGCTKGAASFVLGELARGQGGKMLVFGEHRYLSGGKIQHTLDVPDARIDGAQLADGWGRTMAISLSIDPHLVAASDKQVISTTMTEPASGPGYIVTWDIPPMCGLP